MPWPTAEYQRYVEKALRAVGNHPYGRELIHRFAAQLEQGTAEPVPECGSKACRRRAAFPGLAAWCSEHTVRQLAVHIETAYDAAFEAAKRRAVRLRLFAMRAAGWMQWKRRGDIRHRRTRRTWVGMRVK